MASFDLDESKSKIQMLRMLQEVKLDIATMKDLLEKHSIIDNYEFDAARKYHESLPEFKQMTEYLNQIEAKIRLYKADPQAQLRDMFNAKLNGQM